MRNSKAHANPHTFWFKRFSELSLVTLYDGYDDSPGLTIPSSPLPLSACYWQIQLSLTGRPTVSRGYVSDSFTQGDYSSCMCRWEQLTAQLVLQRTVQIRDFTSQWRIVYR